ncbi:MAG: hypothetical protein ACLT4Y_06315, partial [Bifidobacterium breve]
IGDRRAAVLLHDESHCCPLFFSWEYLPIILRKRNDYKSCRVREANHRRHMDTVIALAIMLPRASAVHRPHTRCSVAPHSHR